MKILISNDDGYQAPGIHRLANSLSSIGETIIVAPDRNRSGASNSLTLDAPLRVYPFGENRFYVNGTPTDCVHLGVTGLLESIPDIVVSGINRGANLGDDVLYSGTVAAAMEGRFLGLPAMAISLAGKANHYETAATIAKELVTYLAKTNLPPKTILNVNVPDLPLADIKGFEITRLGTRHISQETIKEVDPRGNDVYWIGLPGKEADAGPGTDFNAIKEGKVSITPMQVEWTNYEAFEKVSGWIKNLDIDGL